MSSSRGANTGARPGDADLAASEDIMAEFGVRAYDPADMDRKLESQFEESMGLNPALLFETIIRDGRKLRNEYKSEELVHRAIRVAREDIVRLPRDEMTKRDMLLVKIRLLQELLPPPPKVTPVAAEMVASAKAEAPRSTAKASLVPKRSMEEKKDKPVVREPPPVEQTCHICNEFKTTSIRALNVHVNSCLRKRKSPTSRESKKRRTEDTGKNTDGVDEEDDAEEDTLDRPNTAVDEDNVDEEEVAIEEGLRVVDDWDTAYAEDRQKRHSRAIKEWTRVWYENKDSVGEIEAHASAEAAYEKAFIHEDDEEESSYGSGSENAATSGEVALADITNGEPMFQGEPLHIIEEDRLYAPQRLWNRFMPHQRESMSWLYRHHANEKGAILGDEMGMGKTNQAVGFLACLKVSRLLSLPTLVLVPATTLAQWVQEFNTWAPSLRVFVLHESFRNQKKKKGRRLQRTGPEVAFRVFHENEAEIIITTHQGLQNHATSLLPQEWGYVVLDEAHCIRNAEIKLSKTVKQLRTTHRLALTGVPVQNRLSELWSLFDFICPNLLGTLDTFEQVFAEPIRRGGLKGAHPSEIFAAYEAAKSLRNEVSPYMLRRLKKDVLASTLPTKTERVLFCNLTEEQREAYLAYLKSSEVQEVVRQASDKDARKAMAGRVLRCISVLRRICNHPDLAARYPSPWEEEDEDVVIRDPEFLHLKVERSCKMKVLDRLLQLWRKEGAKVLVFCQGVRMLTVLENYARDEMGWPTLRMDGTTPAGKRQELISRFNKGPLSDTFLFLLTTRVGGVGINLTGATKVVIFDPDWNPSTDAQARERAWRLGQTKPVTIFRLICAGTIEDKIYRRQVFKTFLTNKVLDDPAQRRFFDHSLFRDLFTLDEEAAKQDRDEMFGQDMHAIMDHDEGKEEKKKRKRPKEGQDGSEEADAELLTSLFASDDAFNEALDQSRVELASRTQQERVLLEHRAKVAARKAYKKFVAERDGVASQSRAQHVAAGSGQPPSAAALLAGDDAAEADETKEEDQSESAVHARVIADIVKHLEQSGTAGAPTKELVKHGAPLKAKPHHTEVLRSLLNTVARFDRSRGRWFLKKKRSESS